MALQDLNLTHNPAVGTIPPASWGDQIRDNFVFLSAPPKASIRGLSTTVGNNSDFILDGSIEQYDTDSMHSGSNNFLICRTAGSYLILATVVFSSTVAGGGSSGMRLLKIELNSGASYSLGLVAGASNSDDTIVSGALNLDLDVGDAIRVQVRQTGGGNMECQTSRFSARWIGL